MTIKQKIISIGIFITTIIFIVLGTYFYQDEKKKIINSYIELSKGVISTAESTRDQMEKKWDLGVLSIEKAREYAKNNQKEHLLAMIPVVTAWEAAEEKAKELGYKFKTPKFSPRNPDNEPDKIEAEVINMFKKTGKKEHYLIDEETNSIRYFKPVFLSKSCLYCHGNPDNSEKYWGNKLGLDPTGVKMENWRVGEIHGAFEVIQSLDKADEAGQQLLMEILLMLSGSVILIIVIYSFFIKQWIEKPIKKSINNLEQSSNQVVNASEQISEGSQQLSDGAQQQASSVEEITSSLSEIKSTIEQNTHNSREADILAKSANESANIGYNNIQDLNVSMEKITKSSQDISNIIKTIDEIAFQTNLLALNAAVEAARVGEHGLGFAVVAEEVRSLAQRSADAARDTAIIIENAINEVNKGNEITVETNNSFQEILDKSKKTSDIIGEIALASKEQTSGINQLNEAMQQVDGVTQMIASSSEESAATAEEMTNNATVMDKSVGNLSNLFGFNKKS